MFHIKIFSRDVKSFPSPARHRNQSRINSVRCQRDCVTNGPTFFRFFFKVLLTLRNQNKENPRSVEKYRDGNCQKSHIQYWPTHPVTPKDRDSKIAMSRRKINKVIIGKRPEKRSANSQNDIKRKRTRYDGSRVFLFGYLWTFIIVIFLGKFNVFFSCTCASYLRLKLC